MWAVLPQGGGEMCAELEDGTIVEEELNVRAINKARIKRVFLKDDNVTAFKTCKEKLKEADLIILGPGSLYTSVIVNLLVKGIPEAIKKIL